MLQFKYIPNIPGEELSNELFTREEFWDAVMFGAFNDDDGNFDPANEHGYWETFGNRMSVNDIPKLPAEVTHIRWYSK